jgi:N6-adenosine-specific RNA methylase IME4/ParB-like chromosome segregation protein Spo0J
MTGEGLKPHPFCALLPDMSKSEYAALCESIRNEGQLVPIVLLQTNDGPLILDGRHRYRACCELGVDPTRDYYRGAGLTQDLISYVLAANLRRRHLDDSQRAAIAAKLANMEEGRPDKTAPIGAVSQPQAAEHLNVSRRSIQRAAVVYQKGIGALQQSLETGDVPVAVAEAVARLPEQQQVQFLWNLGETQSPPHRVLARVRRDIKRAEILSAATNRELPTDRRFPVILADPAWKYEQQLMGHSDRGVENHYPTMLLEEICALPVKELAADNAVLFLWVTPSLIEAALTVMQAWGFAYKTHFVWVKDKFGVGFHVRNMHELLFIGRRGDIPLQEPSDTFPSVVFAERKAHSKKPDKFREMIETMYPAFPKIELFARDKRPGWEVWGLEAERE